MARRDAAWRSPNKRCADAGAELGDVARTRMMLIDIGQWREAARAHGEYFRDVRPACTFIQVSRFIDPGWLVEIEIDAIAVG
jgi:enamine deaminase RidA (YjgF/YER057c/UK114 family)